MSYTYEGITDSIGGWAKRTGIAKSTLTKRFKDGWSVEKVLTTPPRRPAHLVGSKVCTGCGVEKSLDEFYRLSRRNGNDYCPRCKECDTARSRDERQKVRRQVLEHYSNGELACALCGFSEYDCLDLDHINGGGRQERLDCSSATGTNQQIYRNAIKEGFPPRFRVLCRNCNWLEFIKSKR